MMIPLIKQSLLDDDLYVFSMAWASFHQFPEVEVEWRYKCRMKDFKFPMAFDDVLRRQCEMAQDLSLTNDEANFLGSMPWYPRTFIDYLRGYRMNAKNVRIQQSRGELDIRVRGFPYETAFWECTLLPTITQLVNQDWATGEMAPMADDWKDRIRRKADALSQAKVNWIDFGTRRRASYGVHEEVVRIMMDYQPYFRGTSNVHLARKYGLKAAGTYAHWWEMLCQGIYGPRMSAHMAMKHWKEVYRGNLGTALSDTLTTKHFLTMFDSEFANLFTGVRQDSGDPFVFTDRIILHYKKLGIDPMTKIIVFSDSLNVEKAIRLHQYCEGKIRCTMGIGTHLTNDVGYIPMNHVIKLYWVYHRGRWVAVLKLSDDVGKATGNFEAVRHVETEIGLQESGILYAPTPFYLS